MSGIRAVRPVAALAIALLGSASLALRAAEPICKGEVTFFYGGWFTRGLVATAGAPVPVPESLGLKETFETADGTRLCGYSIPARGTPDGAKARGYLLFAQGDAMLASEMVASLAPFAAGGWDVFVYDFRGFGCSQGTARAADIFSDYRAIVAQLDRRYRDRAHALYGISFGGVVLANALEPEAPIDVLALDSVPDRLPWVARCPDEIDPLRRLERPGIDPGRLLLVTNGKDGQVTPRNMRGMLGLVRGARRPQTEHFPQLGHPFSRGDDERLRTARVGRRIGEMVRASGRAAAP